MTAAARGSILVGGQGIVDVPDTSLSAGIHIGVAFFDGSASLVRAFTAAERRVAERVRRVTALAEIRDLPRVTLSAGVAELLAGETGAELLARPRGAASRRGRRP